MSDIDMSKAVRVEDVSTLPPGTKVLVAATVGKVMDPYLYVLINGRAHALILSDLTGRVYLLPRAFAPGDLVEWGDRSYEVQFVRGIEACVYHESLGLDVIPFSELTLIRAAGDKEG